MMDTRQFISSSETKEKGRTEYYKMLNRVRMANLFRFAGVSMPHLNR